GGPEMSTGASAVATAGYARRFADRAQPSSYRELAGLTVSTVGLGTYLGEEDGRTDELYHEAIRAAVAAGCNLIDSAINYRGQLSERAIGAAVRRLAREGFSREEVVVCTKGGFLPLDATHSANPRAHFERCFQQPGIASFEDVVAGCHVMTPAYIRHQLDQSL